MNQIELVSCTIKEIFSHNDFKSILRATFCEIFAKEMCNLTLNCELILTKIGQLESALAKHVRRVESRQGVESSVEAMRHHRSVVKSGKSHKSLQHRSIILRRHQSKVNPCRTRQSAPMPQRQNDHPLTGHSVHGEKEANDERQETTQHPAEPVIVCKVEVAEEEEEEELVGDERPSASPSGMLDTPGLNVREDCITQLGAIYSEMKEEQEAYPCSLQEEDVEGLETENPSSSQAETYTASKWPSVDEGRVDSDESNAINRTKSIRRKDERASSTRTETESSLDDVIQLVPKYGQAEEERGAVVLIKQEEEESDGWETEDLSGSRTEAYSTSKWPSREARRRVIKQSNTRSVSNYGTVSTKSGPVQGDNVSSMRTRTMLPSGESSADLGEPSNLGDPSVLRGPSRKSRYQCDMCHKSYAIKYGLKIHQRLHTGELPYECPVCGKRMNQKSSLVRHMRIHTGERPYKCSFCHRTFNDRSNWISHTRKLHRNENPY